MGKTAAEPSPKNFAINRQAPHLYHLLEERGLPLIPTRIYLKKNLIKCEIALAKGKNVYDHRETPRWQTIEREVQQDVHEHRRRHM